MRFLRLNMLLRIVVINVKNNNGFHAIPTTNFGQQHVEFS